MASMERAQPLPAYNSVYLSKARCENFPLGKVRHIPRLALNRSSGLIPD